MKKINKYIYINYFCSIFFILSFISFVRILKFKNSICSIMTNPFKLQLHVNVLFCLSRKVSNWNDERFYTVHSASV